MKKFLAIFLSVLLSVFIISPNLTTKATTLPTDTQVTTFTEYEAYKYYISLSDSELLELGFNQKDIEYLRSFNYKDELTKRSKLSTKQLNNLGYSKQEIQKLQTYNGDDNIEEYLFATATISSGLSSASSTKFVVNFNWNWSSCPVFIRNDIIAFVWSATSSNGGTMNAAINKSSSYHNVSYYDTLTGKTSTESKSVSIKNEYAGASSSFSMGYNYGDGNMRWAKRGSGAITINAVAGSIYELLMRFEYGHTYITGSPSFSISGSGPSVGISFNTTTKTESYSTHRYRSNGSTVS